MNRRGRRTCVKFALRVVVFCALLAQGTAGEIGTGRPDPPPPNLAKAEGRLAQRYDRLELLAGRLAELSRSTQPRRARLLRDLIAMSRERDVSGRFAAIVGDLQSDNLGVAVSSQQDLQGDLMRLLDLLLQEDRSRQLESQRKRISKYLEEIKKLIRLQRGVKARTEGGDASESTAGDQNRVVQGTGKLHGQIEKNEGLGKSTGDRPVEPMGAGGDAQPPALSGNSQQNSPESQSPGSLPNDGLPEASERNADPSGSQQSGDPGSPNEQGAGGHPQGGAPSQGGLPQGELGPASEELSPMERTAQRLKQAQQRMQQAKSRLDQAQRENAMEKQEQALRELEQAKAELERILRQLREEELERTLVLLESRFRKMLDDQIVIYNETKKLALRQGQAPRHEVEIASGRLGRREESIVRDADRALVLLREDGTSVAFPEAVVQTRNDMATVARRLGDVKLEKLTQGLEEDIVESLEEILAALQQALKELREQQAQQQAEGGQPGEKPLVDQLAELRMIRALQSRVNRRTQRYGELLGERQAVEEGLRKALAELGRRQESIFHATRDLESGRNK
ncbi:MAG: hypothetical protein MK171_07660 [Pirellulales bacterium]|nr:hypothetical protein [Pirellulales bacterium]